MTLRAMSLEQSAPPLNRIGVLQQRIAFQTRLLGRLSQFGIDRRISLGKARGSNRQNSTNAGESQRQFHCRAPLNIRDTISPNPENSRDTPHRVSNRWLLSFSPKPCDTRNVQPEGRFHASTGAM